VSDIIKYKNKQKITMLTCYDYAFACVLDEAGIDIILIGDSLANVVLGMAETRKIQFSEMLNHAKAVARGVKNSLVVADMPYVAFQKNPAKCVDFAKKFIDAGADAVKIEWFAQGEYVTKKLNKNKIPVMGHIGLTPQTAHLLGGFKVQGKNSESAARLIAQAKSLEDLGIFSLVLECIPLELGRVITKKIKIPTISCGAGKYCDGQVLVLYDLLGLYKKIRPRFARVYADLAAQVKKAAQDFSADVRMGNYPSPEESFSCKPKVK
jgi:3-methyl-2-oxobutanoate hydroxymethyltransferase